MLRLPPNLGLIVCLSGLLVTSSARAASQEAECLLSTDFHIVHFSAFQPGKRKEGSEFTRYCQELPRPGLSYLGIDFMDRDARRVPIALAVVEEDAQGKAQRTLKEIAPQIYPQGVASLEVNFDRPGRYVVLVRFAGEELTDELRIPLSVGGTSKSWIWIFSALGGAVVLGLALSVYRWWRKR
jgi:hypothetical protein